MSQRRAVSAIVVSLLVTLIGLFAVAPAFATDYGSSTHPVKASTVHTNGNAWFYGAIALKDHWAMRNAYHYRDSQPGGHSVYVTTTWSFWGTCADGTQCFAYDARDRSPDVTTGAWTYSTDYDDLDSQSDRGRGVTRVCENIKWRPDRCSKSVTVTLSY